MEWQGWLTEHWFDLVQTIGIVAGLLFTGFALNADAKAKRVANHLALTQEYRELWMELLAQPELFRILRADVDLAREPLTEKEDRFVRLLIQHLNAAYHAIKTDVLDQPTGLQADIKTFFALPIPRKVWMQSKHYFDQDFIEFVNW